MKQFVKALPRDGPCFEYLKQKLSRLSTEKLKADSNAWRFFVEVVKNFFLEIVNYEHQDSLP